MGSKGPRANWRSVDQIAQGMSGIMSITGTDENSPTRVGIPLGDLVSGMWTAIGVQAALAQRVKTGQGQIVETSLLAGLVSLLCVQGQRYLSLGEVPVPIGNDHPVISPYGAFRAKDGLFNMDELHLTRLEPIDRIAALAPRCANGRSAARLARPPGRAPTPAHAWCSSHATSRLRRFAVCLQQ